MALITCPECNKQISDQLNTVCPSCGHVHDKNSVALISAQNRTQVGWFFYLLMVSLISIVVAFFIGGMIGQGDKIMTPILFVLIQSGVMMVVFFKWKKFFNKINRYTNIVAIACMPIFVLSTLVIDSLK